MYVHHFGAQTLSKLRINKNYEQTGVSEILIEAQKPPKIPKQHRIYAIFSFQKIRKCLPSSL